MVMMVMMVLMFLICQTFHFQSCQLCCQCCLAFHGIGQLLSGQFLPGSRHNGCNLIVLTQQRNPCIELCLRNRIGTGKDDGGSGFNLVVIELAKVLHIHLDFAGIRHSDSVAQCHFLIGYLVDGADHIGQLANTGGLNNYTVRMILLDHLGQRFTEVAYQRAANAAGIHFRDVDARILQESAVNANLAEFVLNQNKLLPFVCILNHLFDQGCFARAQKSGINIHFCHRKHLLYIKLQGILYHRNQPKTSQKM